LVRAYNATAADEDRTAKKGILTDSQGFRGPSAFKSWLSVQRFLQHQMSNVKRMREKRRRGTNRRRESRQEVVGLFCLKGVTRSAVVTCSSAICTPCFYIMSGGGGSGHLAREAHVFAAAIERPRGATWKTLLVLDTLGTTDCPYVRQEGDVLW